MRVGTILNTLNVMKGFYRRKDGTLRKQIEELIARGAEHIELTADHFSVFNLSPPQYFIQEIKRLLSFRKDGITFSLHAPCVGGIATGSIHEAVRKASVAAILSGYRLVEELEPTTITIHPETLVEIARDLKPQTDVAKKFMIKRALDNEEQSFTTLCAAIPSEKICIENFHFGDIIDYLPLIEKFNLSICYDRGHDYVRNPGLASLEKFWRIWNKRIRNIHFHNICVSNSFLPYSVNRLEDHRPITDANGIMDIVAECSGFRSFSYNGALVLEEYNNPHIEQSVAYLRKIVDNLQ